MRVCALLLLGAAVGTADARRRVRVEGRQLMVDDEPVIFKGICYSPVPINQSVYFAPYGDYFTDEYSFIWQRDLPLMKAMGANIVRIYGWLPENDHSSFLDAVEANGLYLMATFYMGEASEAPVQTVAQRELVISNFVQQVKQYADHPAMLIWSFGNELNGVWNGYLQQFDKAAGQEPCAWDERYDDLGGCWIHKGQVPLPGDRCYAPSYCVYARLFTFINDAAVAAKEVADVLVVSAFADVDALYDKVARAGDLAPELDAWTAQVYRGNTFGDFFQTMGNATDKPVLLTEYGVDAYHDACGTSAQSPCFNMVGDNSDSYEDGDAQAEYARLLTHEITAHGSDRKGCEHAKRGWTKCTAIGGFLMSWVDEFWKGAKSQAECVPTYDDPKFSPKTCTDHAHVTCGNWDASAHDLCGYQLDAAPDHYVNEEWFGITSPTLCGGEINSLRPREVYWKMRKAWSGKGEDASLFGDCEALLLEKCVALGDGGRYSLLSGLIDAWGEAPPPEEDSHGRLGCSGHGVCTSDWKQCGPGTANRSATPCCTCNFGFAGEGCEQLDARLYVAIGAACVLLLLVLLMLFCSAVRAVQRRKTRVGSTGAERAAYEQALLAS